jgi:hypothetical protein
MITVIEPDPPFEARLVNCTQHLLAELEDAGGGPA